MGEKEPTQRTKKGMEIPVPTREEFMRDLEKVAKPTDDDDSGDSGTEEQEPEGR